MMSRIQEPKTIDDFKHNVKFQLDNIVGYVNMGDYESAFVKAGCMMEEFEALNQKSK